MGVGEVRVSVVVFGWVGFEDVVDVGSFPTLGGVSGTSVVDPRLHLVAPAGGSVRCGDI